ncbi:MAG: HNH endonuclease [Thermoleophilia bacterium]|nr:HNH endonuclease [Thermoleophilia bacterium]
MYLDDKRVRLAAFDWLNQQISLHGEVLPRALLQKGFELDGRRVPLISAQQGIFKPAVLAQIPLSILTVPGSTYDDHMGPDGLIRYSYRGTDPRHRDNVGLIKAMQTGTPLIYFYGVMPGKYQVERPVFIVDADPATLTFKVAVDDPAFMDIYARKEVAIGECDIERRRYITATVRQRMHQAAFRERVLAAYREQCSLCKLKHAELLDAAHIIPDIDSGGEPVVSNGLALCKLHHAAFDSFFLGIRPDYVIQVRSEVLREEDGPMLIHGLQDLHEKRIILPRSRMHYPNANKLATRYEDFLAEEAKGAA